jgi:hypothetical protein
VKTIGTPSEEIEDSVLSETLEDPAERLLGCFALGLSFHDNPTELFVYE